MKRRETAGAAPGTTAPPTPATSSRGDAQGAGRPHRRAPRRTPQLRRREWLSLALLGCLCLLAWLRVVAQAPTIDARWHADGASLQLVSSPLPALSALAGARLTQLSGADGASLDVDGGLLLRSARWSVDDAQRRLQRGRQQRLASLLDQGAVQLHFDDGRQVDLAPRARGLAGLGGFFWLMSAVAATERTVPDCSSSSSAPSAV